MSMNSGLTPPDAVFYITTITPLATVSAAHESPEIPLIARQGLAVGWKSRLVFEACTQLTYFPLLRVTHAHRKLTFEEAFIV